MMAATANDRSCSRMRYRDLAHLSTLICRRNARRQRWYAFLRSAATLPTGLYVAASLPAVPSTTRSARDEARHRGENPAAWAIVRLTMPHRKNRRQQVGERGPDAVHPLVGHVGIEAARLREDPSPCRAGRNAVDAHALLAELECRAACQMRERRLGDLVAEHVEAGTLPADARHVDERARAARDHRGRGELHRQERRAHVDRKVVINRIGLGDRAGGEAAPALLITQSMRPASTVLARAARCRLRVVSGDEESERSRVKRRACFPASCPAMTTDASPGAVAQAIDPAGSSGDDRSRFLRRSGALRPDGQAHRQRHQFPENPESFTPFGALFRVRGS